jgi:hypothetical protein
MATPRLTSTDLRKMLRSRYAGSAWAVFDEVHNHTGYRAGRKSRSCDAMVMGLWPSKGLELEGVEIKVTRADWLNELRDPDKSKAFRQYCDRWWLVISSRDMVKEGELPADWGMMWVRNRKLVVSKGAPKLEPLVMDRNMLAGLLRRASQGSADKEEIKQEYQRGMKAGESHRQWDLKQEKERADKALGVIKSFEEASGVNISRSRYSMNGSPELVGEAVRLILGLRGRYGSIERLLRAADDFGEEARKITQGAFALKEAAEDVGILEVDYRPTYNLEEYEVSREEYEEEMGLGDSL